MPEAGTARKPTTALKVVWPAMHMQIGTKGMKYGLQLPKQKVQPAQQSKKLNVFGVDDGSDDEGQTIGGQIARQAAKKQTDRKARSFSSSLSLPSVLELHRHSYDGATTG